MTGRRRRNFDASAQRFFPVVNVPTVTARPLIESVSLKENRPAIPDRVKERRSEASLEIFPSGRSPRRPPTAGKPPVLTGGQTLQHPKGFALSLSPKQSNGVASTPTPAPEPRESAPRPTGEDFFPSGRSPRRPPTAEKPPVLTGGQTLQHPKGFAFSLSPKSREANPSRLWRAHRPTGDFPGAYAPPRAP